MYLVCYIYLDHVYLVEVCAADLMTNMDSDSTVVYSNSETLSESDGPYFISDYSSDDNNGALN